MSYERRVKVVLHGHLKELYPHDIYMTGYSAAEVLNGVSRQIKELRPSVHEEGHLILVVGYETEADLKGPLKPKETELHVVPAMAGGKGFLKVVLGVALIAASFYMPAAGIALGGGLTITASSVFSFGLSLVLGGLLEWLSPAPKIDRAGTAQNDPEASKYLGATQNTVKIGTRITLAYGEVELYGHYLSFDVDSKDVAL